jgi:hypothetical protein
MGRTRRQLAVALGLSLLVPLGATAASASAGSGAHMTTVVSGLDNPRDLAFGPGGRLYLAEAGHGGRRCIAGGEEGTLCAGFTSKISIVQIGRGSVRRLVTGLLSTAGRDGSGATGVDGISVLGRARIYGIEAGSRDAIPAGAFSAAFRARVKSEAGRLIVASRNGNWRRVADVGHRDFVWSAHHKNLVPGQFPDANPYGVLAGRRSQWVVDAGANTLDRVDARGRVHVVAFFPNPPASDAVPTCIDRGPDGALYIGELTGGGNAPGSSVVWRYRPGASHPLSRWATGLTAVTGCGFDRKGRFFAVEFSTNGLENASPGTGEVVRVPRHSSHPVKVIGGLSFPGGFAAGADGSLYVSNWSVAPAKSGLGSVVRITL